METFVAVYLAVGFLIGFALFGWVAVSSVRRHGFSGAVRGAARTYVHELSLYWRVPVAGWLFVIGLPLIAAWTIATEAWDPAGAVLLALVWLFYLALLRWHYRSKNRARNAARPSNPGASQRAGRRRE